MVCGIVYCLNTGICDIHDSIADTCHFDGGFGLIETVPQFCVESQEVKGFHPRKIMSEVSACDRNLNTIPHYTR